MNGNGRYRDQRFGWGFYATLFVLALAGFLFIVGVYAFINGGSVSSRIAWASVFSVLPSCLTALIFKFTRLIASWWSMTIVYFVSFWLLQGVLWVVR